MNPITIGDFTLEGGGICPEQYDVYLGLKEVGYIRIRHGFITAQMARDGELMEEVYSSGDIRGHGCLNHEERMPELTKAVVAIKRKLNAPLDQ